MKTHWFPFATPLIVLFGLPSVLLSGCGGMPAATSPFAGKYSGSIVFAIGATNIPLSFATLELDSSGQLAFDAAYQAYSGQTPIIVQNKVRGTVAIDGSTVLNWTSSSKMSGKLSLSGNKLTGVVAEDGTNNTVTVRLVFDLTRQ
jgi:hypothetical protein